MGSHYLNRQRRRVIRRAIQIALASLLILLTTQWQTILAQDDIVRPAVSDATWQASFWNNMDLSGAPVIQRSDAQLDFNWGNGSPDPAIQADHFSARWTRYLLLDAGLYRFSVTSDDGVRVFVDDQLLINGWFDHDERTFSEEVRLPAGHHLVRVEYYENADRALVRLDWELVGGGQPPVQGWRGEYYNNRDLTGAPALVRDDGEINFDWGVAAPAPGIASDNFSVRWTRTQNLPAGNYRFRLTVDDGARLWVNNVLLIDQWREQGVTTYTSDIYLPGGAIPIRLEYFEYVGGASVRLTWERTDQLPQPANRWRGEYFNNRELEGEPALTRDEENIDFDWGLGSPAPGVIAADNFSARWTRAVSFPAGTYRFYARIDDGVRLWVNDRLLIDQWRIQPDTTYQGIIALPAGVATIRMEYFEAGDLARASLRWERTDIGPQPVTGWRGEYYNNRELSGNPVLTREDARIDFDWGYGSPAPGEVANERFSVRWTRTVDFLAGEYRFSVRVDDGARLWVNNRLLIDEWRTQPDTTFTQEITLPGGPVPVTLEYYEEGGAARIHLNWERIGGPPTASNRWQGEYFNNPSLSGTPVLVREDRAIDFQWGTGSPAPGVVASDGFSVRWTITLNFSGGRYRFTTETDDGVRLYVDDRLVIDQWRPLNQTRYNAEVNLSRGNHRLRMEYFDQGGAAVARLGWRRISDATADLNNLAASFARRVAD